VLHILTGQILTFTEEYDTINLKIHII